MWIKQPQQVILPRSEGGVDFGTKRLLLLERALPNGIHHRLEWRPGHTYRADRMGRSYAPATLTLSSTGSTEGMCGRDLGEGGCFRHILPGNANAYAAIRAHFLNLSEQMPIPCSQRATYIWRNDGADASSFDKDPPAARKNPETLTIGSDRITVTHHQDGTRTIRHLVLGGEAGVARRKGRPVFEAIATIEVPPAFADFIADAFGRRGP